MPKVDAHPPLVGYVPGVFDMFHVGHLRLLQRASERCDWLVAGVVDDLTAEAMKGRLPVVGLAERLAIVEALRVVDEVIVDASADKTEAWHRRRFDIVFKGSDWRDTERGHALERSMTAVGARVEYLPYTESTSSTMLRRTVASLID